MPLQDILLDIAKDLGKPANQSETDMRIIDINNAVHEIHTACDLPESLKEEIFDINLPSQQVVLPAHIDKIIGMRYCDTRLSIDSDSSANRYNHQNMGEHEVWYLQWRSRGWSALTRDIQNQSVLTFRFPTGLSNGAAFTITITGQTDKSRRISETLEFSETDNTKTSVQNWVAIESIVKSTLTQYDIIVEDPDGNEMAVLPNSEYQSLYQNYQLYDTDSFANPQNQSGVEVLYKHKFFPFKNNQDTYFGTNRYDKAFYWKFMELRAKSVDTAQAYHAKCKQVIVDALSDHERTVRRKINFSRVTFWDLPYTKYTNAYRSRQ